MAKQKLKAVSFIKVGDQIIPWDSIGKEKKNNLIDQMMNNVGSALSHFLSANPEEAKGVITE